MKLPVWKSFPWKTLFVIATTWIFLIESPVWIYSSHADDNYDAAVHHKASAFQTMAMDEEILQREKTADVTLHRLPSLVDDREAELGAIDALLDSNKVHETEKKLNADGSLHVAWHGSQNATLKTLYAFATLPLPVHLSKWALTVTQTGIDVTVDGQAIGATQ